MVVRARTLANVVLTVVLVGIGGVVGYGLGQRNQLPPAQMVQSLVNTSQPADHKDVDFSLFWRAWNLLEDNYIDPETIKEDKAVDGAVQGLVSSLGDPYTVYLPPVENKRNGEQLAGAFYGVGIELGFNKDGVLQVVAPLKDTPADKAGVRAGDLIIHVKDESKGLDEDTTDWNLFEAVDHIRGERGTQVILTLYRADDPEHPNPFEVTLTRGEIVIESVELAFETHENKKIAHLTINRFGDRTVDEWNTAVKSILAEKSNVAGIVLDMRNNPGGLLDVSIEVAGDFIKRGETVVQQEGRDDTKTYRSEGSARLAGLPLIVLVNKGSASASEIVAGALRDQLGSKLVGEKTFGKGTVQERRELDNGGGMHITVARWLLPKSSSIHHEGLEVDETVANDPATEQDEMVLKAVEMLGQQ